MSENMEIQREAVIEIVGTHYEARVVNHQGLVLHQKLKMKHQSENIHDNNAVIILTDDERELGFIPKGYASVYAPAIDSGRYDFNVEIVKAEPDPERPILIVKIISEFNNCTEEEIEERILRFVRDIVNCHAQKKTEYLKYIYSETVDVSELVDSLNCVRISRKLCSVSDEIIKKHNIEQAVCEGVRYTIEGLSDQIRSLRADTSDILKKIQRKYNESLDIDDEDEYYRIQSEIRENRKKFRSYDSFLSSCCEAIEQYVFIKAASVSDEVPITASVEDTAVNTVVDEVTVFSEAAFLEWLMSDGGLTETTANQYVTAIHSIEKLYQTIFGVRKNLLGAVSAEDAEDMIKSLIVNDEYIDADERRNGSFGTALNKFAEFAGISAAVSEVKSEKISCMESSESCKHEISTDEISDMYDYTKKPCAFILNKTRYVVESWNDLYTKLLMLLFTDSLYSEKIKNIIGKSLTGQSIDFADDTSEHKLLKPIRISTTFFAEGNLSDADIVKRIESLSELCSINNDDMIIEYSTQDAADVSEQVVETADNCDNEVTVREFAEETPVTATFEPDKTKPFSLKDALIEILSSDTPEINKYREYNNGISSRELRDLVNKHYEKALSIFEVSSLLMLDRAFNAVGKGCYNLNMSIFEQTRNVEKQKEVVKPTEISVIAPTEVTNEAPAETNDNILTVETILDLIKENCHKLQYKDGFDAYEVKVLLANMGISNVSENDISELMSECAELTESEDGYYILADKDETDLEAEVQQDTVQETVAEVIHEAEVSEESSAEQIPVSGERRISLSINGSIVRAYNYSDALVKVCEFAINYKPFRMARIAGECIKINDRNIFFRRLIQTEGYNRLSSGIQVTAIGSMAELVDITNIIKKYCQIDDNMIIIISK